MSRTVAKQQQLQVGGHTGPPSELPGENVSPQLIGEIAPSWDGSVGRFHLGIVGSREPQPVAHDRPADSRADVVVREMITSHIIESRSLRPGQPPIREERKDVSLEGIAARVGHRVHKAADRPAVARIVSALFHFYGPHKVVGEHKGRHDALKMVVRDVDAVDEVRVFEPGCSTDVRSVAAVIAGVRVRQEFDNGSVIPPYGQRFIGGGIYVRSNCRGRRIDR